jgi:hypothetical protein
VQISCKRGASSNQSCDNTDPTIASTSFHSLPLFMNLQALRPSVKTYYLAKAKEMSIRNVMALLALSHSVVSIVVRQAQSGTDLTSRQAAQQCGTNQVLACCDTRDSVLGLNCIPVPRQLHCRKVRFREEASDGCMRRCLVALTRLSSRESAGRNKPMRVRHRGLS